MKQTLKYAKISIYESAMENLPLEIERKYIIKMPDLLALIEKEGYSHSKISQIYLLSAPHVTHRIRSREYDGKTVYTETKKIRVDKISAIEDERKISKEEFEKLSLLKRPGTNVIEKVRYTFLYSGFMIEIDVYPEWKRTCIMEIELKTSDEAPNIPDFIEIISEVTGNKKYSNAAMSEAFPEEV